MSTGAISTGAMSTGAAGPAGLTRLLSLAMAVACGVAVASIYLNQPLLGLLGASFPRQVGLVRLVPTATQLGYAAGLLLLVPLGDIVERRRLILIQLAALAGVLAFAAAAPDAPLLLAASAGIGVAASVTQQIVPLAAELALPERRGQAVGIVMSGLLSGILLGRVVAGLVGHHFGWRAVVVLQLVLTLATGVLLALTLPRREPLQRARYGALLASLAHLWRDEPALRRATLTQALLFGSFIALWTTLTLELDRAHGLGAQSAGLFGLLGLAGVLLAPLAGGSAERRGPAVVIRASTVAMLLSWAVFAAAGSILALAAGIVLLDAGEQAAMVSHQHVVYALNPAARGRANTVFVGGMFIGSALSTAAATSLWQVGGWRAVCALGSGLCAAALLLQRARPVPAPGV